MAKSKAAKAAQVTAEAEVTVDAEVEVTEAPAEETASDETPAEEAPAEEAPAEEASETTVKSNDEFKVVDNSEASKAEAPKQGKATVRDKDASGGFKIVDYV